MNEAGALGERGRKSTVAKQLKATTEKKNENKEKKKKSKRNK